MFEVALLKTVCGALLIGLREFLELRWHTIHHEDLCNNGALSSIAEAGEKHLSNI